jgi:hypothetical protein
MSTATVKQVIARAVAEPEYRQLLFKTPAQALAGYALSGDEQAALSGLTPETFDAALAGGLEERISRVSLSHGDIVDLLREVPPDTIQS